MSGFVDPHRLSPSRLLCPSDFPGKNTEMGSHILLQRIFSTQGWNLHLLHSGQIFYRWASKEAPKNGVGRVKGIDWGWCNVWTVLLEKTPESPLDCKEIKTVNPKGNQSWIFIRKTDAEAEIPILWPPDVHNWLIGKDPDPGKRQEEKGMTEDKMVGWHHWLKGHEFELMMDRKSVMLHAVHWVTKSQTQLSDWIECFRCVCVYVCMHMCVCACTNTHTWVCVLF